METVFKTVQVYILSDKLGVSQKDVKLILDSYVNDLLSKLRNGQTVKFLDVCYLVVDGKKNGYQETLAYISNDLGVTTKLGKELVFRVLSEFSNFISEDLKKFYSYTIRGLVNISLEEYKLGVYKVRIRKSKVLKEIGVNIVTINSFKRKVEGVSMERERG